MLVRSAIALRSERAPQGSGTSSFPGVGASVREVWRLAPGVPFGESLKLTAKMMAAIPPEEIGRMMSGVEAAELILRIVRDRGRPGP